MAYLDALGARRIPDPTTAGDFCRRFDTSHIYCLQSVFNATRLKVWRQQPKSFFDEAILDADGTMVETTGECKQGMDINYKGQWGYHPLVISLANTGEPLFVVNRSGNRPSHEQAAWYFDRSIELCRKAGFRKILLRGDTDFTQTEHLDRWDKEGVRFIFGIDATDKLYELAEKLPPEAWKVLQPPGEAPGEDAAAAASGERQAAGGRRAGVRGHPHGEGARGRIHLPARQMPEGLSHRGGDGRNWRSTRARRSFSTDGTLLLLHHQHRGEACRGDRLCGQRPLQPGESAGQLHKDDVRSLTAPRGQSAVATGPTW